jgi:hypothetical protein
MKNKNTYLMFVLFLSTLLTLPAFAAELKNEKAGRRGTVWSSPTTWKEGREAK